MLAALLFAVAAAVPAPCGYVEFIPTQRPVQNSGGSITESIAVRVRFPDGTFEMQQLDYDWSYPSTQSDPFTNRSAPDPVFQFPPADKIASEPPLVKYILKYTNADGKTYLKPCP